MRNRRDSAYIILDKTKKYVFLLQKLPYAENYVNTHVADSKETKISLTGLYEICDNIDNKVGGFHKMRWKVQKIDFEDAIERFKMVRGDYEKAVVLGDERCYRTACV